MKKLLMKINDENELSYPVDGYVLGVGNYAYGFEVSHDVTDFKRIKKDYPNRELYASLNRLIFNEEIAGYKKVLTELDKVGLDGIIVGDVAALTYGLKTPIILDQAHLNNSAQTINYYHDNGVSGVVLTNDITLTEINDIKKRTKARLFKTVFGLSHLSTSARHLVSNYLDYFNIKSNSKAYFIAEEKSDDYYRVIEDANGTYIYNAKVLNLLREFGKLDVDYAIIDSYLLDKKEVSLVVDAFKTNDTELYETINEKFNADEGFINKKTIYKVKNNE